MNWIRPRILKGEKLFGSWLGMGSEVVAEIVGQSGFDWMLIDQEHGAGDRITLLHTLQALSASPAAPIVRVPANNLEYFKTALDLGASGIMVPWVNSPDEARQAVSATRYPPQGIRGLSGTVRAAQFGRNSKNYFTAANDNIAMIVQIETRQAVEQADQIAAVEGVDVLFVGPADLSLSLGIPSQLDHPEFQSACEKICSACRKHHKQAGILLKDPQQTEKAFRDGFTFIAIGTDVSFLTQGIKNTQDWITQYRKTSTPQPG